VTNTLAYYGADVIATVKGFVRETRENENFAFYRFVKVWHTQHFFPSQLLIVEN